jgi:hypothetical protein
MKGYYTVKLVGGDLPNAERIALETRYVHALESSLGGHERVLDLCLAAAAAAGNGALQPQLAPELQDACDRAEADAWEKRNKVAGARFSLSAWSATDLP